MGELFFFFGVGASDSSGAGECFFFGEADGDGLGDSVSRGVAAFFFFGLGEGVSSSVNDVFFFFGEGVTDGVGDFFAAADALFFFRGFGVGVGVAKIFLIAAPNDCSAAAIGIVGTSKIERTKTKRMDIRRLDETTRRVLEMDVGLFSEVN